jgi:chromosome partitioning protein
MAARILSVVNLKGGVGKTAIAVNFAAYCAKNGKKTLLVDMDPQTNATFSCVDAEAWKTHAKTHGTVADLLGMRAHTNAEGAEKKVSDVRLKGVFSGLLDLVPSHLDLFTIDLDMANATARETKLRRAFAPIKDEYDIIVCDCPPNLTIPTQNALAASTHFAVPISPDYLSGLGVALLLTRVKRFSQDLEHDLAPAGIVVSRVGRPAQHREETVNAIRTKFPDGVLTNQISERVAVSKAAAQQIPVYDTGDETAAAEFRAVSKELLERIMGGAKP